MVKAKLLGSLKSFASVQQVFCRSCSTCRCIFFKNKFIYLFIYFLGVLGLRFCARAFSSCGEWGPLFIAVHGPLTVAASPVAEHRLQTRRLSSCGSRAQLLRGMWDPPRPGLEPVSPAPAGRLPTTVPPGKPCRCIFDVFVGRKVISMSYSSAILKVSLKFFESAEQWLQQQHLPHSNLKQFLTKRILEHQKSMGTSLQAV